MIVGQTGDCLALVYRHGYVLDVCETAEQAEAKRKEFEQQGKSCTIEPASWVRLNPLCLSIRMKAVA